MCPGRPLLGHRGCVAPRHGARRLALAAAVLRRAVGGAAAPELHELPALGQGADTPPGFAGELLGHRGAVYALAFSSQGWLASGAVDHNVAVWNTSAALAASGAGVRRKPQHILEGHSAAVTALAFSPDGVLVSGSADNTTRLWSVSANLRRSSQELREPIQHPKTVFGVAVQPRGMRRDGPDAHEEFATACWDGIARIFDLQSGVFKAQLVGHQGGLYAVAYSPLDGTLLATASADRTVRIWDLRSMETLWTLRGHKDHVTTVDWSPQQRLALATGGWDRKFRLWQAPGESEQACRSHGQCSGQFNLRMTARHPQLVWKVAFAPGGAEVAACHGAVGQSPTVVIYDVFSGVVVRRLGRHKDTPLTVAWSPDGLVLGSAGMDRKVLLYDGHSSQSDLPQGDPDDDEERAKWLEDIREFRQRGGDDSTNPVAAAAVAAVAAALRNKSSAINATEAVTQLPHPLSGARVAVM